MCAEQLYLALDDLPEIPPGHAEQDEEGEPQELEELLLETEWLKLDTQTSSPGESAPQAVVRLLLKRL